MIHIILQSNDSETKKYIQREMVATETIPRVDEIIVFDYKEYRVSQVKHHVKSGYLQTVVFVIKR